MEGILEGERKEESSMCWIGVEPLKSRGFRYFYEIGEDWGGEGKEEDLKSMMAAGFTFLFICMGNAEIFAILWEWEGR